MKYVIAYSSVSHMGIVLFGLCTLHTLGINGAVLQMFSHGIMTGLFFALVGAIYGRTHTRMIPFMGGFSKKMPFLGTAFAIGAFCSLGLPGMSGFVAELLVLLGGFQTYPLKAGIAATGIVFTAIYILRVVQKIFLGPAVEASHGFDFSRLTDATPREKLAHGLLIATLVIVGLYPFWMVRLIDTGVVEVLHAIQAGSPTVASATSQLTSGGLASLAGLLLGGGR
jgi:NADH-quinone oxidoreductase subunit M